MINQALAMDQLQKAGAGDEGDGLGGGGDDDDDDAMHEKARLLMVQALKEEDEAVQGDKKTKRKKPAGTYRYRWDFRTLQRVCTFTPHPAPPPKSRGFDPCCCCAQPSPLSFRRFSPTLAYLCLRQ